MARGWVKWPLLLVPGIATLGVGAFGWLSGAAWFDPGLYAGFGVGGLGIWAGFWAWLFPRGEARPDELAVNALLSEYQDRLVADARRLRLDVIFPPGATLTEGDEVGLDRVFVPMRALPQPGQSASARAGAGGTGDTPDAPRPVVAALAGLVGQRRSCSVSASSVKPWISMRP